MCAPPPRDNLRFSNTTGILQKKTMWFIGVKVEQVTSAPPPKKKLWIRPCRSSRSILVSGRPHETNDPRALRAICKNY